MDRSKANLKGARRRWLRWLVLGVLLCAAAAASPWLKREWDFYSHMRTARLALASFIADNAVIELTAAEKLRPESAEVQFLLGVANRKGGHIDDVRAHLEKAMRLGWAKKDVRFQLTLLAFQAGDHQAENELKQMASRPMDDDTAEQLYESLSLGYLSEYRMHDAMLVLDYWVAWRPNCIRPRLLRAEIFDITSQTVKEEEEYQKAIEIEPGNFSAHLGLAHVLEMNHDTKHALEHFRFCYEQWPANPVVLAGIANCLKHQGKLAEAKQAVSEMASQRILPPLQRAAALSALGEFAEQERDLDKAIELLSEAAELDPYNSQWRYRLGVCLAKKGRTEDAKRSTDRAAELDRILQRRSELEQELLSHPDDAELRYEFGEVLLELGYPKPSAAMMLSALRWNPQHEGAHAALAKYYEGIGRQDLATMHREDLDRIRRDNAERNAQDGPVPPVAAQATLMPNGPLTVNGAPMVNQSSATQGGPVVQLLTGPEGQPSEEQSTDN